MPGLLDTSDYLNRQNQMLLQQANDLANPYSQTNQYNRQYLSTQFGSSQPNYFEIAASQGLGTGSGIAALQQAAAKRQAGLLTGLQFGQMMNENQKTALGYRSAAQQGTEGLLTMQYQDKAREEQLAEQKREFDQSKGSIWDDILTTGLGVAGSVLGGPAGGAAGGLIGTWLGLGPKATPTTRGSTSAQFAPTYGVLNNNQHSYGVLGSDFHYGSVAPAAPSTGYFSGYGGAPKKWNPATGRFE